MISLNSLKDVSMAIEMRVSIPSLMIGNWEIIMSSLTYGEEPFNSLITP